MTSKWSVKSPLRIVFCGRHFAIKNGAVALAALAQCVKRYGDLLEPVYVGPIPPGALDPYPALRKRLRHYPAIPRAEVLSIFETAHVFFHPTTSETVGNALLEAASAGMAIVTTAGLMMEHVGEILPPAGVLLHARNEAAEPVRETSVFAQMLSALLENPATAQAMGMANYEWICTGPASVPARNRLLGRVYEEAQGGAPAPALRLADLPGAYVTHALSSAEVDADLAAYRILHGIQAGNILTKCSLELDSSLPGGLSC